MKLKPCPFCGCEKVKIYIFSASIHFLNCWKCGASVRGQTFEESQKLWNRSVK